MATAPTAPPDYPPHILNHMAQIEEQTRARSGSLSNSNNGASPSGRELSARLFVSTFVCLGFWSFCAENWADVTLILFFFTIASDGGSSSQQSSTSPFFDFLKIHTSRNKGKTFSSRGTLSRQCCMRYLEPRYQISTRATGGSRGSCAY